MKIQRPPQKRARIEIIPMIDAIFFLLVYFMFSSLSMVKTKGVQVALPVAGTAQAGGGAGSSNPTVVLTVTARGEYYVGHQKLAVNQLTNQVRALMAANPRSAVVVNVAKNQTAQSLVTVLDAVNKVKTPGGGHPDILIATEPLDLNGQPLPARAAP